MATAVVETGARTRTRTLVAALGKITVASLVGVAAVLAVLQAAIIGELVPPLAIFTLVALIVAGIIGVGWRWVPILGAVVCGLVLPMNADHIVFDLTHPGDFRSFALVAVAVPLATIGVLAGIGATVQNYRRAAAERRMPRLLPAALIGITGVVLGALLVAAIPQQSTAVGITPEALAGLPTLKTKDFMFSQKQLQAKAGETIAYRLENDDGTTHYFEIDELNVHAPIPAGKTGLAMFKVTKPGTYTFYCGPHSDKGKMEGMVGKLIVTQ